MKRFSNLFFALLPALCSAQVIDNRGAVVTSTKTADTSTTYAVVIGISKYKQVRPLKYADRDAQVFRNFLVSKEGMELDSGNVKLFLNEKATVTNIGTGLSDIVIKKLKKGDRVIFFFAGHGDYDADIFKDRALLLFYDAPSKAYFQNLFSGDYISTTHLSSEFIEPVASKGCEVILIIDACHASGMNKNLSGGMEGGRVTMMALENMTSPVKIYSCQTNQYSLEGEQWGGGRGLFSFVLMEGLYGMADIDKDHIVTLRELQRYLEDNVPALASPNKQDPIVKSEDPTEPIAKVNDAFLALYKTQKNKDLRFLTKVEGTLDAWIQNMDSTHKKLYKECAVLVEKQELDIAYEKFLAFEKADSISIASASLRRNLAASLQKKAATILTPILEDVTPLFPEKGTITVETISKVTLAEKELEKASSLLGEGHFLHKNLEARILFLKALAIHISGQKEKINDAISYLEQSSTLEPNAPYTYFELGYLYRINNSALEKAKLNFEKYLNLIPNSPLAYYNLAIVYDRLKDYEEALKKMKKAIELKPFYAAYLNLGNIYTNLKNYEEAISANKMAIKANPNLGEAYLNLGNTYLSLKDSMNASQAYRNGIKHDSNYRGNYINLGSIYFGFKKHNEAAGLWNKALKIKHKPSNGLEVESDGLCVALYNLCCYYSLQKKTKLALEYLQKSFESIFFPFRDLSQIQNDTDLDNIRTLPEFKLLLEKFSSAAELAKYPNLFIIKSK